MSVGKIVNLDTQSELTLPLLPVELRIDQNFNFAVEPCMARQLPIVSFQGGAAKVLSVNLIFDQDTDEKCEVKNVLTFLQDLEKINENTRSTPLVKFKMGTLTFPGYVSRLSVSSGRFDKNGDPTSLRVSLDLLASEEAK